MIWNPLANIGDGHAFHTVMVSLSTCGLFSGDRQRVDKEIMAGSDIDTR